MTVTVTVMLNKCLYICNLYCLNTHNQLLNNYCMRVLLVLVHAFAAVHACVAEDIQCLLMKLTTALYCYYSDTCL